MPSNRRRRGPPPFCSNKWQASIGVRAVPKKDTRATNSAPKLSESMAELVRVALTDGARGDALGVPQWAREPSRMADAWLRAADVRRTMGQLDRAGALLDYALDQLQSAAGDETAAAAAQAVLASARIRVAERTGATGLAAQWAERRLATEKNGGLAAALAMRVAEHAASEGDANRALDALSQTIGSDPGCRSRRAHFSSTCWRTAATRSAFAAQLESFRRPSGHRRRASPRIPSGEATYGPFGRTTSLAPRPL